MGGLDRPAATGRPSRDHNWKEQPPTPVPKLAPGATGDIVKALQNALIANGFSVGGGGADGKFGDRTLAALEAFQDDQALPVQPFCDRACWAALYNPPER